MKSQRKLACWTIYPTISWAWVKDISDDRYFACFSCFPHCDSYSASPTDLSFVYVQMYHRIYAISCILSFSIRPAHLNSGFTMLFRPVMKHLVLIILACLAVCCAAEEFTGPTELVAVNGESVNATEYCEDLDIFHSLCNYVWKNLSIQNFLCTWTGLKNALIWWAYQQKLASPFWDMATLTCLFWEPWNTNSWFQVF